MRKHLEEAARFGVASQDAHDIDLVAIALKRADLPHPALVIRPLGKTDEAHHLVLRKIWISRSGSGYGA